MIISIGEVLWDDYGDRRVLGGAPLNVAYHLHALGTKVQIISRVGQDDLGAEACREISALGLNIAAIAHDTTAPTGLVTVSFDGSGNPHYAIGTPAAWDNIDSQQFDKLPLESGFHLVCGTLAQRAPQSRQAINYLLDQAETVFYDANIRPPFTPIETVIATARKADVVKLNREELLELGAALAIPATTEKALGTAICAQLAIETLVVTGDAAGAWALTPSGYYQHPGFAIKLVDPVGAGDAFFAALIKHYLEQKDWPEILAAANRNGAYVASLAGATPKLCPSARAAIGNKRAGLKKTL